MWRTTLSPYDWAACQNNQLSHCMMLSKLLPQAKSGDLVLFNDALKDPQNIIYGNNKFSHSGIIVVINNIPYILEIVDRNDYLLPKNVKTLTEGDVLLSPMVERIQYYPGSVSYCALKKKLNNHQNLLLSNLALTWRPKFIISRLKLLAITFTNKSWGNERFCHEFICDILQKIGITNTPIKNKIRFNLSKEMVKMINKNDIYINNYIKIVPDKLLVDHIQTPSVNLCYF
jgi:hypothetical protein